jgi:alcohol dehydrogenase
MVLEKSPWEEKPKPVLLEPADAVVKILKTTICGTDLHIMKGDLPEVTDGRIIGHEGVGIIEVVGSAVTNFKKGDHVIILAMQKEVSLKVGIMLAL